MFVLHHETDRVERSNKFDLSGDDRPEINEGRSSSGEKPKVAKLRYNTKYLEKTLEKSIKISKQQSPDISD